jgi:hypothetical protein
LNVDKPVTPVYTGIRSPMQWANALLAFLQ